MPDTVTVPSTLKGAASNIWRSTFLGAYDGTCASRSDKDACAAKIAWSAVKKKYKKDEDGTWVEKTFGGSSGPTSSPPTPPEPTGPPTLGAGFQISPPDGVRGSEAERWKNTFLNELHGDECRTSADPDGCARAKANAAIGLEEKGMSKSMEDYHERKSLREQANLVDGNLIDRIGDQRIIRPDHVPNMVWNQLPPGKKTVRAEATRRIIERNYAQAVEDAQVVHGWKAKLNHYSPEEWVFSKFLDSDAGPILVRAVLIRKADEEVWALKPMSTFASGSMAKKLDNNEIRHIRG